MHTLSPSAPARRILRLPAVCERTGSTPTTIWRWERAGKFPSRVQLGGNSIGWFEDDVATWQASRPRGIRAEDSR